MESTGRRSLRPKKKPHKFGDSSPDQKISEAEYNDINDDTDEIVNKFSRLRTSSNRGGMRNQRLVKTHKKNQNISTDESGSEDNETVSDKKENINQLPLSPSRRGRKKKIIESSSNKKLSENTNTDSENRNQLSKTPGKRGRKKNVSSTSESELSVSVNTDSDSEAIENIGRPSEALFEGQDVSGKTMFGFQRNKRRGGMAQKVLEAVNSPLKPFNLSKSIQNSPSTSETSSKVAARNSIRNKIKEKVAELDSNSSFEDFSDSGSEYKGSDSESSESESNSGENEKESNGSDSDKEFEVKTSASPKKKLKDMSATVTRNNKNQNYIMKSDDYFSWQASKIVTSNHTLQKLKNPKLSEDQLQELLTSCNLNQSSVHEKAIHEMFKFSCGSFSKWMFILHEGFNILLYGLGSKRNILKAFHKEMLGSLPSIVVNGYFPSLSIKDITDSILLDIFEIKTSPGNIYEAVELIEKKCQRQKNTHLYLIVHNIDGPMLRNNKSQNVLSSLADISNIHLLASVDHINTPLIWDHYKLSKFNFTWWDATSFLPYTDETSFESSMLVQRSGALALSSLGNVYQSLTKNSKGIFMLIVKYQMKNKSVKYYQGMPFKVLYSQCREHFLVSSDLALRTQLTEFLDHKLVKSKRTADGVEQLIIPINNSLLQQFLDQHT